MQKFNVAEKLALVPDHWHPRIVAELNGQQVKVVKLRGAFVWHRHEREDEDESAADDPSPTRTSHGDLLSGSSRNMTV